MTTMKAFPTSRSLSSVLLLALVSFANAQPAATPASPAAPAPAATPATPAPATTADPATPTAPAATPALGNAAGSDHILPAPDRTSLVGSTIAGGLASSSTVAALQRQEFDNRDKLLGEVSTRVQEADGQLNNLKQKATNLQPDDKQAVDTAVADYEKAKAKFQQSLEAARNTQANTWDRAKVGLATDYAFYVAAAAALEVALPN